MVGGKQMTTERKPGYYRIKMNGVWVISQYTKAVGWIDDFMYEEEVTYEIDETPISPEPPKEVTDEERVVCAAIHWETNIEHAQQPQNIKTGIVFCGLRHSNCYGVMASIIQPRQYKKRSMQGFLTTKNRFVDRKEAGEIAFKSGQIKKETDCLFSEDLY